MWGKVLITMNTQLQERQDTKAVTIMLSADGMLGHAKPKQYFKAGENGKKILVLEDVPVFRSGSFEDSMGRRNTWEEAHLASMVDNFTMLAERNILPYVPARSGHPGWIVSGQEGVGKVIGWHTGLKYELRKSVHDGGEYFYLLASFEVIDEEAQKNISEGLWRNRSSEIATYITNDGAEYFPVYMGFAYVDIPAVEGLNGFSKQHPSARIIQEETTMTVTAHAAPTPPALPAAPALPVAPVAPAAFQAAPVAEVASQPAPVAQVAEVAAHAAPVRHAQFKIGGNDTADFAAVQAHIDMLEKFQSETIIGARLDFVKSLVEGGKILAAAQPATEAFATSLTDVQFTAWKATQEDAPVSPILAVHGAGGPTFTQGEPEDEKANRIEVLKGVIANHKRVHKTAEYIKSTPGYAELMLLDPTFAL